MNWKHLLVIALAALLSISACKKKKAEETPAAPPAPTEPAPTEPAAGEPTEPAPTEPVAAPTEPVAAPTEPTPTEPVAGGDPCEAYIAKMIECASAGMPAEAVEATVAAMKDGLVQSCEAMKTAGQADYISKAMDACNETACGAGGADWMTCHATKMAELAMAAVGAAMP